ncbi:MAG TPA: hypothetical protein VFB79_24280 [Candidatus Angelobacter sp.]|nr:hypothetical protein [Candidatus Angelobacter sp.]
MGELDWPVAQPVLDREDSADREALVRRALSLARSYLPLLGQENVRRVMAVYLDAVEKGIEQLEHSEVAAALGISESTARQCAYRGFNRLKRVAAEKGINLNTIIPDGQHGDSEEEKSND